MAETSPIVVCVDGSDGSNAAVRYAAIRALDTGRRLHVLHASPRYVPIGFGLLAVPSAPGDVEAVGEAILSGAVALAARTLPADRITSRLLESGVVALAAASRNAEELVLGADHSTPLQRFTSGSLVDGVLSGAVAPVTVVPDSWSAPLRTNRGSWWRSSIPARFRPC